MSRSFSNRSERGLRGPARGAGFENRVGDVIRHVATKHAVNGFVGSFFEDIRRLGIKVSTIPFGYMTL